MKAILVIEEMPMNCSECPLRMEYDYESGECFNGCEIKLNSIPDWCPLKPLPTKITTATLSDQEQESTELFTEMALLKTYADGWNDCLKEIADD